MPTPQPNWIVTVGLAKESTWGTPVAASTFLSTNAPVFTEKQVTIFDKGLRGIRSATQSMSFGAGHSEFTIPGMPWYGDDSGHLLMAMLGIDTLSGGTAKTGTLAAASVGATTLTYTVTGATAIPVTGDVFRITDTVNGNQVITPTLIAGGGLTWTVPALTKAIANASTSANLAVHTLTMNNAGQPPSYTLAKYDALVATARQLAGCYFEDINIKFASSAGITIDAKGRGKLGAAVSNVTATYSTEPFNVPWQSVFTLNALANANVIDFSIDIKAANDQIFGMNATQSPTAAVSDQLTVTGAFTVVPQDYTEFLWYINNTQPAASILLDNGNTQTVFQMSKIAVIDPTTLAHSGNYTTLTCTYEAISNATDAGTGNAPIKAILRNRRAAQY